MRTTITHGTTLVDHLLPARTRETKSAGLVRDGLLIIGFSLFLALCARVSFHLPFTPVPISLQTLAVLLSGAALGSRRGALAMLVYLAEGIAGLPVFVGGAGLAYLAGPTGGYLVAFPFAAFAVGWLCEQGLDRRYLTSALAMLPGSVIIYALGMAWLAVLLHGNLTRAFVLGVLPFIPGDLLKLIVAAALLPTAWMIVRVVRSGRTSR
ncbi:MAG: biotin transporter BioY [Ktedonobacteraceae bacterium]|nr:biotin transporter BioY [Ktedonobacteraceae bacterium]